MVRARSIESFLLGFWVLRHIGTKFGWRIIYRLCPGEKDSELTLWGSWTYWFHPSKVWTLSCSWELLQLLQVLVGSRRIDMIFRQWWRECRGEVEILSRDNKSPQNVYRRTKCNLAKIYCLHWWVGDVGCWSHLLMDIECWVRNLFYNVGIWRHWTMWNRGLTRAGVDRGRIRHYRRDLNYSPSSATCSACLSPIPVPLSWDNQYLQPV